jgi:hypothetical protein
MLPTATIRAINASRIDTKIKRNGMAFNKTLSANCSGVVLELIKGPASNPRIKSTTIMTSNTTGTFGRDNFIATPQANLSNFFLRTKAIY